MHSPSSEFNEFAFALVPPAGSTPLPPVDAPGDAHDMERWRLPQLDLGPADDEADHGTVPAGELVGGLAGGPALTGGEHGDASAAGTRDGLPARVQAEDPVATQLRLQAARIAELEAELGGIRGSIAAAWEAAAAEGRAAGFDEGRAAGRAVVEAEGEKQRAAINAAWKRVEATVEARLASLDASLGDAVHELVLALGRSVLHAELTLSGAPLQRLIDEVLAGLRDDLAGAVVVLHPDDLALLGAVSIATRADAACLRGDLCIRTASGDIEVSLRDRIAVALAHLAGSVE